MKISFDLDGTLFVRSESAADPDEPPFVQREKEFSLRDGTRRLLLALADQGCEIWLYTNSYRSRSLLLRWFRDLGFPITGVVNQQIHEQKCEELGLLPKEIPMKMPQWFGFDLHVDDSMEILKGLSAYGFPVCRIDEDDSHWAEKVLAMVPSEKPTAPTDLP